MVDFDDQTISVSMQASAIRSPAELTDWAVRWPSRQARRWSWMSGFVHGLVWAFPFVAAALLWRRVTGPNGTLLWPGLLAGIGVVLFILRVLAGILAARVWWFAYRDDELLIEHGLLFRRRDHVAFDRVQYLGRRAGPIMRSLGIASLSLDTAAGRAMIPAIMENDIEALETRIRAAMQRATAI